MSFQLRFLVALTLLFSLVEGTFLYFETHRMLDERYQLLNQTAEMVTELNANSLSSPVWAMDEKTIGDILSGIGKTEGVLGASIEERGSVTYQTSGYAKESSLDPHIEVTRPILHAVQGGEAEIGRLSVRLSKEAYTRYSEKIVQQQLAAFFLMVVISVILIYFGLYFLMTPMRQITHSITQYAEGEHSAQLPEEKLQGGVR